MRFVIGGADSGKRGFVRENYGIDEILMADYDSLLDFVYRLAYSGEKINIFL